MDREQLAHFLRTRREALQPEEVGLVRGTYRRVRGLRREEIAYLSGMSADYYTRIEQQRGPAPSGPVVARLAKALRLSWEEREHLLRLSGRAASRGPAIRHAVSPGMMRLFDHLRNTPAQIVTPTMETLAQTDASVDLFGDETRHTGYERSLGYRWFTDPGVRRLYPEADHVRHSRAFTAQLRAVHSVQGADSEVGHLVQILAERSSEFAHLWDRHEITVNYDGYHKPIYHHELGRIDLYCQILFDSDRSQTLLAYTALPGTASSDVLKRMHHNT